MLPELRIEWCRFEGLAVSIIHGSLSIQGLNLVERTGKDKKHRRLGDAFIFMNGYVYELFRVTAFGW